MTNWNYLTTRSSYDTYFSDSDPDEMLRYAICYSVLYIIVKVKLKVKKVILCCCSVTVLLRLQRAYGRPRPVVIEVILLIISGKQKILRRRRP